MKIRILLILACLLVMAATTTQEHVFASFMPRMEAESTISSHVAKPDTTNQKGRTSITITRTDKSGKEDTKTFELSDWFSMPDTIRERLQSFEFRFRPELNLDSALADLRVRLKKLSNHFPEIDTLTKNMMPEGFRLPQMMEMDFEDLRNMLATRFKGSAGKATLKDVKIVDMDKKELKSHSINNNNLSLSHFAFYPNANREYLTIEFSTKSKKPVQIKIYDLVGRIWYEELMSNYSGNYHKTIPVEFKPGVYIFRIEQDRKAVSKKIVVGQ